MTMAQYNTARSHYGEALHQILEEDVPNHEPPAETREPDASTAASASESDSKSNATEDGLLAARAKLRTEALSWGVRESEVDHVLQHHPLAAARNILWKARREQSITTLTAVSAAD
jgi:hypothetical protein